jgi:hypothetical protein
MSSINFFQRYSQPENVVTNNTLRLLAQLYDHKPSLLNELIGRVVDGVSVETGISMEQQTVAEESVPDGALTQESFKILIETKPSDAYDIDQLKRHCEAFEDEQHKILMLLLKSMDDSIEEEIKNELPLENRSISFTAITYEDLIENLIGDEGLIEDYDRDLENLVKDYRNFCSDEDLLPIDDLMRLVPCGGSHEETVEYDVYYAPAHRSYQKHQYIAVYFDKCVQYVGKLDCIVEADKEGDNLVVHDIRSDTDKSSISEEQRNRILGVMDSAKSRGNDIESGCEFFLVDKFYETDFKKVSKYGVMKKNFRLRDCLDMDKNEDLPNTEKIAELLKNETWE